jgi:hypothetical protein
MATRYVPPTVANAPGSLRIVGESAAGAGWHHEMKAGEAVRIMTGAPVPAGADAVQQVELTKEADSQVEILQQVEAGRSIVRQGQRNQFRAEPCCVRAGERINARNDRDTQLYIAFDRLIAQVQSRKNGRGGRLNWRRAAKTRRRPIRSPRAIQIRSRFEHNYTIRSLCSAGTSAIVERLPLVGEETNQRSKQKRSAKSAAERMPSA